VWSAVDLLNVPFSWLRSNSTSLADAVIDVDTDRQRTEFSDEDIPEGFSHPEFTQNSGSF